MNGSNEYKLVDLFERFVVALEAIAEVQQYRSSDAMAPWIKRKKKKEEEKEK